MISVYKLEVNEVDYMIDCLPAALFYIDGVDLTSNSEHGRSDRKETLSKNLMVKNHSRIDAISVKEGTTFLEKDFDYRR